MKEKIILFVAAAAVSFIAAAPGEAEAYGMRIHAFECVAFASDGVSPRDQWTNNDQGDEIQSTYDSNFEGPRFSCPILGTEANPITTLAGADVYLFDGSTIDGAVAQACTVTPSGGSKSCGSVTASVNGFNTLSPNVSAWGASASNFAYVYVKLPSATVIDGSGASTLRGIKVFD